MRRTLINGSVMAIMAVALVAIVGWVHTTPASAASRHIYLAANGANPRSAAIEPRTAPISRDSSLFLNDMDWTHWSDRATGTGIATINLCDPDCATSKLAKVSVSVALTDPRQVCGREFYTTLKLTLTGPIPDGLGRSTTVPITPYC